MKICPACRTAYDDDGLNFCLEDGSVLTFASRDPAPTAVMEQRPTNPASGPGAIPAWGGQNAPGYSMQPAKKSSRTWVWVVGIFAVLILLCGGGFVGFFAYVASITNSNTAANKGLNNSSSTKANTFTRASPSASPAEADDAIKIDLSDWVKEPTEFLKSEFQNDEFLMTSKKKGYYYVLVAQDQEAAGFRSTRVTIRNTDNKETDMGYGLVFHSEMTPLTNGYAFLIDTKRKKYRVVRHENEEEKNLADWTASNLIKEGTAQNVLEARNNGDKIELHINGQLAHTLPNKQGPKSGVPGLYAGDGATIGFSKLEVVK